MRELLGTYLKPEDIDRVADAFLFSADAHKGQFRISGAPYFSHPLAVAGILTGWHLDAQALCAALLHDVAEDTDITLATLNERFGKVTAELVDGVSKLDKIEFQSVKVAQAENFRKMLLAMARDVRVILIKLADRLHNMRTLETLRPDKRRRIARETLDIYAPIANRLGLNTLYRELQELGFKHLYPLRYRVLSKAVKAARGNRREVVGKILNNIKARLAEAKIEAEVMGREKHLYGIYRKMRGKSLSFSEVLDIYGFRVIVKDVPTCYLTLGVLHGLYKPVPGKFKDYIAIPKGNGYKSLHSTLIGPYGTPVEAQIRTTEMHHIAEAGVASHWLYKDSGSAFSELQQMTHNWLQSLLELQSASGDPAEFLEHVKIDLFPSEVFVFTPAGKILSLPRGATAVDFAYAVHTDIGNRCVACRINQELTPLRAELKSGDQVEIIVAAHANPNPAWLSYVKTARARSQIRYFLKTMQQGESARLGERLVQQAFADLNTSVDAVSEASWEKMLRECGAKTREEVMTDVGLGKRLAPVLVRRLLLFGDTQPGEARAAGPVSIRGSEGMAVELARCCRPIPGDPVIGLIKKGQGLIVHAFDCPHIAKSRSQEAGKWLDVEWAPESGRIFDTRIRVVAQNAPGVLAKIAGSIAEADSNILNVSMDEERDTCTTLYFTLQVADRVHLANIMRALRHIPEVVRISRARE
ncbi:MAG: bifunctional (p)ppGpp synthetase/guanosine-3',5'-bis(diphosphate) 3'-pyrophosphohydrolase [Zoogloeaceae bacterium]|nr:bifunctional (p)ppGpp synthetase/guanosine-3',5'-bis(diphosphate) 3'-pyrophosphohydrolase [Zoogloeaceae bacterium]